MKKTIIILFAVAIASANMLGQEPAKKKPSPRSPEERTEKIIEKFKGQLALSDDQVVKAKEIILKREQKRDELRKQFETNRDGLQTANKENMKAAESELETVLSKEQMDKLKEYREEMKQKRKERGTPPQKQQ